VLHAHLERQPTPHGRERPPTQIRPASIPGEFISIDTFESTTKGLIAQVKGNLTKAKSVASTVFLDHFSDLSFVYMLKDQTNKETLKAKYAFEVFAKTHGVVVQQYHADSGRFANNAFANDARAQKQKVSYCGVNAHHQNGRAEKCIRDLQDHARVLIMHMTNKWPEVITPHLWPYAIRLANKVRNHSPSSRNGLIPLAAFARTCKIPDSIHLHTFGCPAYILMPELQAKRKLDKWSQSREQSSFRGNWYQALR